MAQIGSRRGALALAGMAALLAAAAPATAEEEIGARLFAAQCAPCHGGTARGDGPLTGFLDVEVPDLTGLSARNGGAFPMLRVIHVIDGSGGFGMHAAPMPAFGPMFAAEAGLPGQEETGRLIARGQVLSLALYLESLQQD